MELFSEIHINVVLNTASIEIQEKLYVKITSQYDGIQCLDLHAKKTSFSDILGVSCDLPWGGWT